MLYMYIVMSYIMVRTELKGLMKKSSEVFPMHKISSCTIMYSSEQSQLDTGLPGLDDFSPCTEEPIEEPTLHELQSKAAVKGWSKLRMGMPLTAVETSAMPCNQNCLLCCEHTVFRCQQCGLLIYYCYNCYSKQQKANFLHVPEKCEVQVYLLYFPVEDLLVPRVLIFPYL